MQSIKTELKKAAVVLQSHTSRRGGGLGISILNQKLLEESLNKVADTNEQASMSLLQWASDEDENITELYTRLADLEALHARLYKRYAQQIESARQCYKAIEKGDKHLQDLKKDYESQQVKANRVRRQVDSAKKKKEKDKVLEALEIDLATAYSQESKAADDLRKATENHNKFKMLKIQEALRVTQKANVDFHKDAGELALTQDKIIQLFIGHEKEEYVPKAGILAASHVSTLAEDIGLPRPISIADKQAGASFKTHQAIRTSKSSQSSASSRLSMPVYTERPEKEIQRPSPDRAQMPLPALPLYPSLPSGNSFDNDDGQYGELYSEQYYSYTDMGDSHPSGILMRGDVPPPCPPRPAHSLQGDSRAGLVLGQRNSAPAGRNVDLTATDVQGNPLPPPAPDSPDQQEYMYLITDRIYDAVENLDITTNQTRKRSENEDDYMALQAELDLEGFRQEETRAKRGTIHDEDPHNIY